MPVRSVRFCLLATLALGGFAAMLWAARMGRDDDSNARQAQSLDPLAVDLGQDDRKIDPDAGWPQLFGPTHDSISHEEHVLTNWPADGPPVHWDINIGTGYSAPVVWGKRLILLQRVGDEEIVQCLAAETGNELWKFAYPTSYECTFGYSSGPYSTPIISGSHVYTLGAQGQLHCLDLETGNLIWSRNLSQEYQVPQDLFGVGHTPLLEDNRLILNVGGTVDNSGIVALDAQTGKTIWTATDHSAAYATPRAATIHGRRYVFVLTGYGLVSLDPGTGKVHWSIKYHANHEDTVSATSPLVHDDLVFASVYQVGSICLRILPDGKYEELWRHRRKFVSQFNPLVCVDGFVYGWHFYDHGFRCIELASGNLQWKSRSPISRGSHIAVGNRMILLGEFGRLASFDINPQEPIERSMTTEGLLESPCFTSPALHRGLLYVRNEQRLLCLNLRDDTQE